MKTKNFIIGALLVVLASVAVVNTQPYARRQSSVSSGLVARAQQVTGDRFTVATTTPRGVTVVARVTPRPEVLRAIDNGFADLFAVAARRGYRARLNFRRLHRVHRSARIARATAADNTLRTLRLTPANTRGVFMIRVVTYSRQEWCWHTVRQHSSSLSTNATGNESQTSCATKASI